jgi:hypothetical protein
MAPLDSITTGKFCWAAAIPVIANVIAVQRKNLKNIGSCQIHNHNTQSTIRSSGLWRV